MALLEISRKFDQKFAWSFLGVLLALAFGSITIYTEFFDSKRPTLQYDVLTSTSVLDVREKLSNLIILFDGIDVSKQGLALRVITVRVFNDSNKDILKGHFDDQAPLGIQISTGEIIKAELADASNDYLLNKLSLGKEDDQTLLFPSIILEAGEFFVLKLLILHPEREIPTINAIGKVAGIRTIPVREAYRDLGKEPFITSAFGGDFLVQISRLLLYTVGTFVFFGASISLIVIPLSALDKRKRKRTVKEFKAITNIELNESDEFIFTQYVKHGPHRIIYLRKSIEESIEHPKVMRRRGERG